jgi:hypothetical protein
MLGSEGEYAIPRITGEMGSDVPKLGRKVSMDKKNIHESP